MRGLLQRLFGGPKTPPPTPSTGQTSGERRSDAEADARPEYGGADDHKGSARLSYSPERDGDPDAGEVVWCWVAYEEDPDKGKDRPVIVMGDAGPRKLLVVQLSSQEHHADDSDWVPIGTGDWDSQRRPSYADVDRPLSVAASAVRREGGTLPKDRFEDVADELRRRHGYR